MSASVFAGEVYAAVVLGEKERAGTHATPHLSEPAACAGYLRQTLPMTRNKIEVRLLKAEQANCWRIVAATAPVKRPRIFIIGYLALAFG